MYPKTLTRSMELNSSIYLSTLLFSQDNLDKYGKSLLEIFTIDGLRYPGIALAFTKKLADLEVHKTQEQANKYVGKILAETLYYLGLEEDEINWNPNDDTSLQKKTFRS